jgi:hypothetical protein
MKTGEGPKKPKAVKGLGALKDHPLASLIPPEPVEVEKDVQEDLVVEVNTPAAESIEVVNRKQDALERMRLGKARVAAMKNERNLDINLVTRISWVDTGAEMAQEDYEEDPSDSNWKKFESRMSDFEQVLAEIDPQEPQNVEQQELEPALEPEVKVLEEPKISREYPGEVSKKLKSLYGRVTRIDAKLLPSERSGIDDLSQNLNFDLASLEVVITNPDLYKEKVEAGLRKLEDAIIEAEERLERESQEASNNAEKSVLDVESSRGQLKNFEPRLQALEGRINKAQYSDLKMYLGDLHELLDTYEGNFITQTPAEAEYIVRTFNDHLELLEKDFITAKQGLMSSNDLLSQQEPIAPEAFGPEPMEDMWREVLTPETRREKKRMLGDLVEKVQAATVGAAKDLITEKETKKQKDERERREGRENRLERMASEFAAELKITDERDALLAARRNLYEAEKQYAKDGYAPDNIGDLRKIHNDLAIAYTQKLDEKAAEKDNEQLAGMQNGSRKEGLRSMRGRAALVRIHDTVRTPMDMHARVREEIRQEKNGTLNLRTPLVIASKALNGYNAIHDFGAEKYVNLFHKNESPEKKHELIQKIAKASKLVTAAGVTSFVFGGANFGVRLVRSFVGASLGGTLAVGAGKAYDVLRGKGNKEAYENERKEIASRAKSEEEKIEKLERQQLAYKKGNKKAIQKERQMVQFATAIATGGATSMGFSMAGIGVEHALSSTHSAPITNLPSVRVAAQTLHGEQSPSLARAFAGEYPKSVNTGNLHVPASQIHEAGTYPAQEHAPAVQQTPATHTSPTAPEAPRASGAPATTAPASHAPSVAPEAPKAAPAAPAPTESYQEVKVAPGQGADKMFSNLHKAIDDNQAHSHLVEKLVNEKPHLLAQRFGFPDHNANGYMQPGDSVKIENHQLVFHRGGHAVVLMHENPDGSVTDNPEARAEIQKLTSHHHHVSPHREQTPAHEQPPAQEKPSAPVSEKPSVPETPRTAASSVDSSTKLPAGMNPDSPAAAEYLTRLHNPTSHVPNTAVTPEAHAPNVSHETSADHTAPVIQGAPPSVEALTHTDAWQKYHDFDASKVLLNQPDGGDTAAATFRTQLFSIMRESGVGPHANETITQYTSRAVDAMRDHTLKGIPRYDTYPAIYEATDHHLQIHGGDLDARFAVAKEYLSKHPDAEIVMENPGQSTPFFLYSKSAIESGEFPGIDITKLAKISNNAQLVF